jgi:hypothetical protein
VPSRRRCESLADQEDHEEDEEGSQARAVGGDHARALGLQLRPIGWTWRLRAADHGAEPVHPLSTLRRC